MIRNPPRPDLWPAQWSHEPRTLYLQVADVEARIQRPGLSEADYQAISVAEARRHDRGVRHLSHFSLSSNRVAQYEWMRRNLGLSVSEVRDWVVRRWAAIDQEIVRGRLFLYPTVPPSDGDVIDVEAVEVGSDPGWYPV